MLKEILILLSFFIAGGLFVYLRGKIFNRVKKMILPQPKLNASIGNTYHRDGTEVVSSKKFVQGFFSFFNPVLWIKDIVSLFNMRKLTIYLLIGGILFAYAYWQGQSGKPISVKLGWGKEAIIEINADEDYLHIDKNGNVWVKDKNGNVLKQIKAKDIPTLRKYLRPYAFQLKPVFIVGGSAGLDGIGAEIGAGVSFIRAWKMSLEAFITSHPAVYLGTSYSITDNSGVGLAYGKGLKEFDDRIMIYYRWRF